MQIPHHALGRRSVWGFSSCAVAILAVSVLPGFSAEASKPTRSYLQTSFTTEDGLNSNVVNAIQQTQNGLLWVGTMNGLLRFDGHRFLEVYSGETFAIAEGRNGDLWMATSAGVLRARKASLDEWGAFSTASYHLGKDNADIVDGLLVARDGTIWATTRRGIYRFEGRQFSMVVPDIWANRLEEGSNGHLLIIGSGRFLEWDGQRIVEHPELPPLFGVAASGIFHVIEDRQGARWYATQAALYRIKDGAVKRWVAEASPTKIAVFRIHEDHAGEVYVTAGTDVSNGVYRVGEKSLEPVKIGKGGRALYADREDAVWIGTNGGGLIRSKEPNLRVYSTADGLPSNVITTVLTDHNGTLWAGSVCGGLSWFDGRRFHTLTERDGLTNSCVTALAEDTNHDLWIGTPDGVFRYSKGRFNLEWKREGTPFRQVWQISPANDDSLWFATGLGAVHFKRGVIRTYTTADGLSSDRVMSIYQNQNAEIWAGTAVGIDRLQGDRFVPASDQGRGKGRVLGQAPSGSFYAVNGVEIGRILERRFTGLALPLDPSGMLSVGRDLWFVGNGIFRISTESLKFSQRFLEEPFDYLSLTSADGLSTARHGRDQPQIAVTRDGKMWFAQFQGLVMLDPALLLPAPKAAISMGEIVVDRKSRPPGHELKLTRGPHHVELHFDTIEISSPERTHLQYRLEDVESGWSDAGPSHSASYIDIPVGTHRFHVRATNRDGVWDRAGITYNISQEPFLYQTKSFRLFCALAGLALIAGTYRMRLRQVSARVQARLQGRLAERERIARELHDTLLQGFHSVIMRLDLATSRIPETEPAHSMLQAALEHAEQVMTEGRNRVRNLRSSADKEPGLPEALARAGKEIGEGNAAKVSIKVDGQARDLQTDVSEEVYWIGHEALVNSFRHAKAQRIDIEITYDAREFRMRVRDEGRGIDAHVLESSGRQGHWGLVGMRERAEKIGARLDIMSRPGAGTVIEVCVPASTAYKGFWRAAHWLRRLLPLSDPAA